MFFIHTHLPSQNANSLQIRALSVVLSVLGYPVSYTEAKSLKEHYVIFSISEEVDSILPSFLTMVNIMLTQNHGYFFTVILLKCRNP